MRGENQVDKIISATADIIVGNKGTSARAGLDDGQTADTKQKHGTF